MKFLNLLLFIFFRLRLLWLYDHEDEEAQFMWLDDTNEWITTPAIMG